jgi:autotransporter-associated beta strand protein
MKSFLTRLAERVKRTSARDRRRGARPPRPFRPRLEALEDRAVPTIVTWGGNALFNGNWTNGANWIGGHAPNPGDELVFPNGGGRLTTSTNNFAPGTNFHSITFTGGGYVLNGNSILLGSVSATNAGGVMNSAGSNTIALPLQLAGSASNPSVFPDITFSVAAGTPLTVSGVISGTSPFTSLSKTDTGVLILSGANTYEATTLVKAGFLRATSDTALGSTVLGTDVFSGATLDLDDATIRDEFINVEGQGAEGLGALRSIGGLSSIVSSTSTGSPVLLDANAIIRVDNSVLTIQNLAGPSNDGEGGGPAGPIPVTLTKVGAGPLVLTGSNTSSIINYNVVGGRLEMMGTYTNGSVTVFNGAQLTGTGTAPGATVRSGGHIDPGATINGAPWGRLTLNGNTAFNAGSFLDIDIDSSVTTFDRIRVNGTVNVAGSFLNIDSLSPNQFPPLQTPFTIVDNDGTADAVGLPFKHPVALTDIPDDTTFADAQGRVWKINYNGGDGNDVVVTYQGVAPQFQNRSVTPLVAEGSVATLRGTIVSPDPQQKFILEVSWGDGTPVETFTFPPGSDGQACSVSHRYLNNAPGGGGFQIHLFWHNDLGLGNTATMAVTVLNVPPDVDAGPDAHLHPGDVLNRQGSFADPGSDTWTATVDYGDGSGPQELQLGPDKKFHLHHKYQAAGTYTVTVQVVDDDGGVGTASFLVIVD